MPRCATLAITCQFLAVIGPVFAATTQPRYYAHEAVHDANGVLAPWYTGQNGQFDERIRVAAETLKRYPWTDTKKAVAAIPEYIFSGAWKIAPDGTITIPPIENWANGDLGQRASYILSGLIDYYRYSGDAAALAHITLQADALLDHELTPDDHPWPRFLISVPVRGKPYGQANPQGFIQLDIVAEVGLPLVKAAQITGNQRWMDAAKHWADLLAEKRNRQPGMPPWARYANPEDAPWEDRATGGVAFILDFFDVLIRDGYTGRDGEIVKAREAGIAYLRDVLLPDWLGHDTWGRNYWDWPCGVQVENVTEFAARYVMAHPDEFPNWRCDTRNILTLFLNRTGADPRSGGDVYSGAWAYPESSGCCGRSLWYGPLELANVYGQFGVLADSEWAREMARRQLILATHDFHPTGVVEDNIDGGAIVAGDWFKIAHPMALKHVLAAMAWQPEVFGPSRENHIVRSSSVVTSVVYGDGIIAYRTHDAPAETIDVLRLAFKPTAVTADDQKLPLREDAGQNGFQVVELADGDCIATIRHDGARTVRIEGDDSQQVLAEPAVRFTGNWHRFDAPAERGENKATIINHVAADAGSAVTAQFTGNQIRLIGNYGPAGGLADVYIDDVKQLTPIDTWNPSARTAQVLFYRNGLAGGPHTLKVVTRGAGNPASKGTELAIREVQYSAATPKNGRVDFGEGGGPTEPQRFLMGYPGRTDFVDSVGRAWRPGTEFTIRLGSTVDTVASSWWTQRTQLGIAGTSDPELYRYGVHGREFWVDFTVGPGTYFARLKFAETRNIEPPRRAVTILINGKEVVTDLDIAATAVRHHQSPAGAGRVGHRALHPGRRQAVDLVFNGIAPVNGVISIRFRNDHGGEAIIQAIEIGPGDGGAAAEPVVMADTPSPPASTDGNLLVNGDFEQGLTGDLGSLGKTGGAGGWTYLFAGPSVGYLFPESAYSIHPEWGLPMFHTGKEALRTHTNGRGHTVAFQVVEVKPETPYTASVWVRADNLHGKGFGTDPADSAGLWIQELDAAGSVVVDHPKKSIIKAGDFRRLGLPFTTGKGTVKIRYILDTVIASPYVEGHVTYDNCSLIMTKSGSP